MGVRVAVRAEIQCSIARYIVLAGAMLGTVALVLLSAYAVAYEAVPAGQPLVRLGVLAAAALAVAAVCAGASVGTGVLLRRLAPQLGRRATLDLVALAWWPAAVLVPLAASLVLSGAAAHHLLHVPDEATAFALYVAAWMGAIHLGVVGGAWLARGGPAHRAATVTREPDAEAGGRLPALPGPAAALGLAVVATAVLNWGLIQQLTMRQGEFTSHFGAARVMMRGVDPYDMSRDIWQQINVPPATLLFVYAPWMWLPEWLAPVLYGIVHAAAFAAALYLLLRRLLSPVPPLATVAAVVLLVGSIYAPWRESFWLGQPNGFIFLSLALALVCALRQRWFAAGALVAVSLLFKPVAGWVLLYLLIARRFRALAGAAAAGLGMIGISAAVVGVDLWREWAMAKVPLFLRGTALYTNISLPALQDRLFLTSHGYYASAPLPDLPLARLLNGLALVSAVLLLLFLVRPSRAAEDRVGHALEFSLAVVLSLTTAPLTWLHYATAALIGFAALLGAGPRLPVPRGAARAVAGLGIAAFALLSVDQELLLIRTASLWERWPLMGSLSNLGLPALAAALGLALWLHDRAAAQLWPDSAGRSSARPIGRAHAVAPASTPRPPVLVHPDGR